MTERDLADLRGHLRALLTALARFQEETNARIGELEEWRERMETARTDTIFTKMKRWTASLTTVGRLLNAMYRIYLVASYMAPPLIPIWWLIRSWF